MSAVTASSSSGEWRAGARTVVSAAIGYGTGPLLVGTSTTVFIRPIMEATGWSTTQVLVAPFLAFGFAIFGPVSGKLIEKIGLKRVFAIGLIPYAVILLAFAFLPFNLGTYYGFNAGIGVFGGLVSLVPWTRAIAGWFDRSAGKAFGLLGVGGAGIPVFAIPLITWAIYTWGFHAGYVVLALLALVISLPAALIGIKARTAPPTNKIPINPEAMQTEASVTASKALRTPFFWLFALTILFAFAAISAFATNMQPIFLDAGLSVPLATTFTSLVIIGVAGGRMLSGFFLDKRRPYLVAVVFLGLGTLGALALVKASSLPVALLVIAAFLVSLTQGAEADFLSFFLLKRFGRNAFGTIFGFAYIGAIIGGTIGGYAFAIVRDATGSYSGACVVGACFYAVAALLFLGFHIRFRKAPFEEPRGEIEPALVKS